MVSFKPEISSDLNGWKFGTGWAPSYAAFGRMRFLTTLQDASLLRAQRVLIVAAGGGGVSSGLVDLGCNVVINDLREEVAKDSLSEFVNGECIQFEGGDLFTLSPERIGRFDLVLACEIIEHVAHPDRLLEHLKSFLTPNGNILLTTPNGLYFRNKLPTFSQVDNTEELEAKQFQPDADGHLFLLTPHEIQDLAESVGLKVSRLNVWGCPILTGHLGLRVLAGPYFSRSAYLSERLIQKFPSSARLRFCTALTALLHAK